MGVARFAYTSVQHTGATAIFLAWRPMCVCVCVLHVYACTSVHAFEGQRLTLSDLPQERSTFSLRQGLSLGPGLTGWVRVLGLFPSSLFFGFLELKIYLSTHGPANKACFLILFTCRMAERRGLLGISEINTISF